MKVEKVDHIHIAVNNLDKAITLFTDLLGREFDPVWQGVYPGIRTAYNKLGLDFIENKSDPSKTTVEGILCISFKVADIEEAIAELESRGIKMTNKFKVGKVIEAWFEPANTMGVQIELCEYPGDDITAATYAK
jgi:methylmalonyl-CoA/ethylmalonyl-CoA epimerase